MATVASGVGGNATQFSGQGKMHIAPDGDAITFYWDGSAWQYKTAVAPYTTWSSATAVTGAILAGTLASYINPSTGDVHVVYKRTGGPYPTYRKFTKGSAGAGWTMGSASNIATSGDYGNDSAPPNITLDRNGFIWVKMTEWVGGYNSRIFYSTNGTSWTNFYNGDNINQNGNAAHLAPIFNGATDYMLSMYQSGGDIRWRRVTTTGGTIGTISSEQSVNRGLHDDHSSDLVGLADGRALLLVCPAVGNEYAPTSFIYTPSSDSWQATGTVVGTSNNSRNPSLVRDPVTNVVYGSWSEYVGANNYSIPYKPFTPGADTWGSAVTLFASGKARLYNNGGTNGTSLVNVVTNDTDGIVESAVATVGASGGSMAGAVMAASAAMPIAAITAVRVGSLTGAKMAATALSPVAVIIGGASMPGAKMAATALSPIAAITAVRNASLTGAVMVATALSPIATIRTGALFSADVMEATAVAPAAAVVGGAVLAAATLTASALSPSAVLSGAAVGAFTGAVMVASGASPIAIMVGGAALASELMTAASSSLPAVMSAGARADAALMIATALSPDATISGVSVGSGLMNAQPMLAVADSPDAAFLAGQQLLGDVMVASALSPDAALLTGTFFLSQIMAAIADMPDAEFIAAAHMAAEVMAATARMPNGAMAGSGLPTGAGQYYFMRFILGRRG